MNTIGSAIDDLLGDLEMRILRRRVILAELGVGT
jgi:hypothetical protein